jgi:hypothetical protein
LLLGIRQGVNGYPGGIGALLVLRWQQPDFKGLKKFNRRYQTQGQERIGERDMSPVSPAGNYAKLEASG